MTLDKHEGKKKGNPNWKKGESGNPKGRPPKILSVTSLVKEELEKIDPTTGKNKAQLLAETIVDQSITGNVKAFKELLDRVEGKVPQAIKHQGDSEAPLKFTLKFDSNDD